MQYKSIPKQATIKHQKDARAKRKKTTLICYNEIMSLIVAPMLVIAHWRGIWDMMDIWKNSFPLGPTLMLGYVGIFSLDFFASSCISVCTDLHFSTESAWAVVFNIEPTL